jgi:hypothetical protein
VRLVSYTSSTQQPAHPAQTARCAWQRQLLSPSTCTRAPCIARYHATLEEPEQLELLQDRLEDLPPPIVVRALLRMGACLGLLYWRTQALRCHRSSPNVSWVSAACTHPQADLNGDGFLEVIIATHDYKLQAWPCSLALLSLSLSLSHHLHSDSAHCPAAAAAAGGGQHYLAPSQLLLPLR